MLFSIAVTLLFLSFFASVVLTGYLRNIARRNKFLIDIPDKSRKFHFRPTPMIGGLSIHLSMLLSSLFMLFLIDYKYDFQFQGITPNYFERTDESRQVAYSKKLTVTTKKDIDQESFRLNITEGLNAGEDEKKFDVSFGSESDESVSISQVSKDIFNVTLPSGLTKTYKANNSGIIELDSSGKEINAQYYIGNQTNEFFLFSSFTAAIVIISLLLQAFILLDDMYGIRAGNRLIIQSAATLALIFFGNIYIENLKFEILGIDFELGLWGIPFTTFAVVGIINAFNMIDGINGLCAGFALIAIISLQIASGFDIANYSLIIAMGSIIGFLFYNLGFLGTKRRVFLGDNGSTFLGFLVAWTCINYSQSPHDFVKPVTCLWIVAIPLLDCLRVMSGRIIRGILPFSPGRDHIHHKLQLITNSSLKTLTGLLILGSIVASIGIILEKSYLTSEFSLMVFGVFSILFYFGSNKLFKTSNKSSS